MVIISLISTILLSFLLTKIEGHIKFILIIPLIILIYSISKFFDLPSIIFILIFGLFLENINLIRTSIELILEKLHIISKNNMSAYTFVRSFLYRFFYPTLDDEIKRFKDIVIELTFLIRSLFFIIFGFMIKISDLVNLNTLILEILITITIYIIKAIQLKLSKENFKPLILIAPRGLITILLYLSIPEINKIYLINNSLIIQVIVLTSIVMTIGLMINKEKN